MASGRNKSYNNAANMERRVVARLTDEGFAAWRTPGSKSPADVIAVRLVHWHGDWRFRIPMPQVRLVQVKGGAARMTKKAQAAFADYAAELGCEAWLCEKGLKFSRLSPSGEDATQNEVQGG